MITGVFYGTIRKYGNLIFEKSTSSPFGEATVFDSDIELSYNSDSDDSDSHTDSDYPSMSGTSQELWVVPNWSPNTDWIGVTPTTTEYSFTAEKKLNICDQNLNSCQTFDTFSHIVTEDFLIIFVLRTNKYAPQFIISLKVTRSSQAKSWKPTNNSEFKNFFGTTLCMSPVKMPEIHLHWSGVEHQNYSLI